MNETRISRDKIVSDLIWLAVLILGTLIGLALLIRLCGQDPREALSALWAGAFGSRTALAATSTRAAILALYALGVAISFRAGTLNIGAEGQSRIGAAMAAALGTGAAGSLLGSGSYLGIAAVLLGGALAGALWSLIAGILRAWRGVPDVISTLMLNFIALELVRYFLSTKAWLQGPGSEQKSDFLAETLRLHNWETSFHPVLLCALLAAGGAHVFLFHTPAGFALRAVGLNPVAALTAGMRIQRLQLASFAISGALAGLGGALGVLGLWHLSSTPTYPDYGFMAIAVALVANLQPLRVLPAAVLFAGLEVGAKSMQGSAGVSYWVVHLIEGLIILAILMRGVQVFQKRSDVVTVTEAAA